MEDVVSSGAELSASVDTAAIESAASGGGDTATAAPSTDQTAIPSVEGVEDAELFGVPEDDSEEPDDSEPGAADEEAPEETQEQPAEAKPTEEELPEGVEHKITREGKHKYYLPEAVYQDQRSAVDLRGKLADILGEDPTPEAIEARNSAYIGYQRLEADLFSGDPAAQKRAVEFWIDQSRSALERGDVASDPMVPLAATFVDTLAEHHPHAWGQVMQRASRATFDDIYEKAAEMMGGHSIEELQAAAQQGNAQATDALNTLYSIQRLDRLVFGNFKKATDLRAPQPADPLAAREAALAAREAEIQRASEARASERWTSFQQGVRSTVATGINKEVETALAGVKDSYKDFPAQFQNIVKTLDSEAREAIKKNSSVNAQIAVLTEQARRAASDQRRQEIAQRIADIYSSNARRYVAANKARVLGEAANALKAQNDATHARRQAGAERRAPAGGGTPVRRSLIPTPPADFEDASPEAFKRHAAQLFGAR